MLNTVECNYSLASVISIAELGRHPSRSPDYAVENSALVALADALNMSPEGILQKLAETALTLCGADSAGVSLLDASGKNFHWPAVAGEWASHVGGGTPRDFGPCGTVLDRNMPLLFSHPERDFPYFAEVQPLLEEALLIPFYVKGEAVGTIWVVSHNPNHLFESEDLRVMTSLATFAATAFQTLTEMAERKRVFEAQSLLLQEMGHRIKNQFALASALVTLSARSTDSPERWAEVVQTRLTALARANALTRPELFGEGARTATLEELLRTVVAPYDSENSRVVISGADVPVRENQLTNLALVFNEMATNSAKYGALSVVSGVVRIDCSLNDNEFSLLWSEKGGPSIDVEPKSEGFGGRLERELITNHFGGRISKHWGADGLVAKIGFPSAAL
jgi:two-component sensor histidine kinase